ncbi:MAG: glycosyltransferase family 2 protein [Treponema sp.]|nr:glycosyltransferase family 2 protein [Treponema sp.]
MRTLSIIIPVYNREAYVGDCAGSILGQDFGDFELIMVDDGSTDSSLRECGAFKSDPRVMIIHKENEGVSIARNTGLAAASSPYVMFVDSDDMLGQGMLSAMMRRIQDTGSDLCVCGIQNFRGDSLKGEAWGYKAGVYTKEEYADVLLRFYTLPFVGGPVAKVFRRDILDASGILFEPRESYAEDFVFNMRYLRHARRIAVLEEKFYLCRTDTANSLSRSSRPQIPLWERKKFISRERAETLDCLSGSAVRDGTFLQKLAVETMIDACFSEGENRYGTLVPFISTVMADTDGLSSGRTVFSYRSIRMLFRLSRPLCILGLRAARMLGLRHLSLFRRLNR